MCFYGACFVFFFFFVLFFFYSPCTEKVVFYLPTCCLNCPVQCVQPPSLFHTVTILSVYIVKGHVLVFSPRRVASRYSGNNRSFY